MDFDKLLVRFFGTEDIDGLSSDALVAGMNRLQLQFGLEQDGERRFGYWCLLHMLGVAPDLESAFDDEEDREAARDFVEAVEAEMDEED